MPEPHLPQNLRDPGQYVPTAEHFDKPKRTKFGLEAMCLALLRRMPGGSMIDRVIVEAIEPDERGRTWELTDLEPPQSDATLERMRAVVEKWRDRFDLR